MIYNIQCYINCKGLLLSSHTGCYMLFTCLCAGVYDTFSYISETGETHQPVVSHWQTLSHSVVHLILIVIRTHNIPATAAPLDVIWYVNHSRRYHVINNSKRIPDNRFVEKKIQDNSACFMVTRRQHTTCTNCRGSRNHHL